MINSRFYKLFSDEDACMKVIWVVVDDNKCINTTPELTPVAGNVYNYTITINEPTNVTGENGSN